MPRLPGRPAQVKITMKQAERQEKIMAKQVTNDTIIVDVLKLNPDTAQFFFEIGMHCLGCPSASGESIAQACAVHGEDADALVERINAFLADNE